MTPTKICETMRPLLDDAAYYQTMKQDLHDVKVALGDAGAVKRVAQVIISTATRRD